MSELPYGFGSISIGPDFFKKTIYHDTPCANCQLQSHPNPQCFMYTPPNTSSTSGIFEIGKKYVSKIFTSVKTCIKTASAFVSYNLFEITTIALPASVLYLKYSTETGSDEFEQDVFKYTALSVFSLGFIRLNKMLSLVSLVVSKQDKMYTKLPEQVQQTQSNFIFSTTSPSLPTPIYTSTILSNDLRQNRDELEKKEESFTLL
jgi:hypothetical protein